MLALFAFSFLVLSPLVSAFVPLTPTNSFSTLIVNHRKSPVAFRQEMTCFMTASVNEDMAYLYNPSGRDEHYGSPLSVAQYLVDLHDAKATFNFCGGMLFQLVLTEKLRSHLFQLGSASSAQPNVFDATKSRMSNIPNYDQSAFADNLQLFHGREIRKVKDATGGMQFVLQLSMANANDPQGWTQSEIENYDGWGHDIGRDWRTGDRLIAEGFKTFQDEYGPEAFSLHHRFYLHMDAGNRMWLAAEDGCEGTPQGSSSLESPFSKLFGLIGGGQ